MSWPARTNGKPIPTYNLELVSYVPKKLEKDDNEVVRQFGKKVCEIVIASADLPPGERQVTAKARVERLIAEEFS